MMKRRKPVNMWVDPNFKRLLKMNAAEKGKDVISYTEEIAGAPVSPFEELREKKRGMKNRLFR